MRFQAFRLAVCFGILTTFPHFSSLVLLCPEQGAGTLVFPRQGVFKRIFVHLITALATRPATLDKKYLASKHDIWAP